MVPEINIWAVLVATLSTMMVGSIWYTAEGVRLLVGKGGPGGEPGECRSRNRNHGDRQLRERVGARRRRRDRAGVLRRQLPDQHLVTAVILWAGFTAARFVTHDAFENRPPALTVLNISHELVTYVVMALIIGLFGIGG